MVEGFLLDDPKLTQTPNGTNVCTFEIASNRSFRNGNEIEEESSFFNIETWGNLAKSCAENAEKGRGVRIVGRLKQDRWVTDGGINKSAVKIIAEHVEYKPRIGKVMHADTDEVTTETGK